MADAFPVLISPQGWRFEADPDRSLFESARAAGIRLPTSCRNGTCRACMSQLRSGSVAYRIERPGLTREERNEGWILPCVAKPTSELELHVPEATLWDAPR
ncbi:2Fe-2S iron-sulfur cluster binding domain-containing protein [Pigmentiphaga aceris]|uniref:2Fe-2S iron-sulfur cluster binding domain-containing protein n=1 Tax=Pigmentiphaga aceris TaxID=1940612 RepID=A0A5C0AY73_9BURK|nr:2Fe-2S iron-sulfur cluster-binding protein [Pigmentiphaga aceris]QEI07115.1 2Fe-2S iron-sulfur cluster binding domain-containing protein [Pigmentiphaga aceris]